MLTPGHILCGRYRIDRRLGSGGLATTYAAADLLEGQWVALKILSADPSLGAVLRAEFDLLSGRVHPHLCRVLDFGYLRQGEQGQPYYAAELVQGESLLEFASQAPPPAVRRALCDALTALAWLHAQGICHGDFKPHNVLVDGQGKGVLIDLSCAERMGVPTEFVRGTPGYIAPELRPGVLLDGRSDLFGVGTTLEALREVLSSEADRRLCQRCCSQDPGARPADVEEAIDALGGTPAAKRRFLPSVPLLGRGTVLSTIETRLSELRSEPRRPGPRVVWVQGAPGFGKSRVLRAVKWLAQPYCEVVEGRAQHTEGILGWLGRAVTASLPPGANGVIEAREQLASGETLRVLVFDDVGGLGSRERNLFDALTRLLRGDEPVLLVCSDWNPAPAGLETIIQVQLEALACQDVEHWAGTLIGSTQARVLQESTGGSPALIEVALTQICAGRRFSEAISDLQTAAPDLSGLSADQLRSLTALAVCGGLLDRERRAVVQVSDAAAMALIDRGLARYDGTDLRLPHAVSRSSVLAAVDPEQLLSVHQAYLGWLEGQTRPEWIAARIEFWLDLGDTPRAESEFLAAEAIAHKHAWAFSRLASRLAERCGSPEMRLSAARTLLEGGNAEAALELGASFADLGRIGSEGALLRCECELRLGRTDRAAIQLTKIDPSVHPARVAHLEARLHIARGAFRDAERVAEAGLAVAQSPEERARLLEVAGLSSGYLGEMPGARQRLLEASSQFLQLGDIRGQVRAGLSLAIVALRSGEVHEAIDLNQQMIVLAERQALDDQLATALVNLGTALQKAGDWGGALIAYERALRLSAALGKGNSEAALSFNLANLYLEIGLFDRAQAAEQRARTLADALGLGHIQAPLARLRGESLLWQGHPGAAREYFLKARKAFLDGGATRDGADCELWLAEASRRDQAASAAVECLVRAEASGALAGSVALKARHLLLGARLALDDGQARTALGSLNRAKALVENTPDVELMADIDCGLAQAYDHSGHPELMKEQLGRARRAWQRLEASIPEAFHSAFEIHPRRRQLFGKPASEAPLPPLATAAPLRPGLSMDRLERFFAVNRALNSSLAVDRVLENAMDAAIELTAAERGFVLLAGEAVSVAAARNLDRERIGRSQFKFSRSIAERVIATDEPLITIDAQSDERFRDQQSVHAMRLKSVVCVPIRSQGGVLGALYLDNRFEPSRFGPEDVRLLLAFADQVAIALENARLHAELAARTQELEAAQSVIQRQLEGQAQTIELLTREVEARQQTLECRFDYSQIAGNSAPMRAVFAKLDRIIESELPVLVQGESGTGKELCARAIHFNSARKKARLVSVNCAALPEPLLESELFGHRRGAFTGADRDRTGLLAEATGGTVFLDEVGEMSLAMQAKFLRVLEEKEVRPLGSEHSVPIDVRIVCATNRNLLVEVSQNRFRQDLYYRLGVVEITLPPLRERHGDLPLLIDKLLHIHHPNTKVSAAALKQLSAHRWPGNVRELANVLARAAVMAKDGMIQPDDLALVESPSSVRVPETRKDFDQDEARRIRVALVESRWNISLVSRELGIPRQTLYRKLDRYGIRRSG